jgi:hypothetical protein
MKNEQEPIETTTPKKKLGVKILETAVEIVGMAVIGAGLAGGILYIVEGGIQKPVSQNEKTSPLITLNTPRPSEAPGTPTPELSGFTWRHINPGETVIAGKNDFILGDVDVNGVKLYDDNEKTGLIVDVGEDGILVSAKWGADIRTVLNPNYKYEEIEKARKEMLATGGENQRGLEEVNVVRVENMNKKEAGK